MPKSATGRFIPRRRGSFWIPGFDRHTAQMVFAHMVAAQMVFVQDP
jgi:hypothetical protein